MCLLRILRAQMTGMDEMIWGDIYHRLEEYACKKPMSATIRELTKLIRSDILKLFTPEIGSTVEGQRIHHLYVRKNMDTFIQYVEGLETIL